jgi:hypothetical protein
MNKEDEEMAKLKSKARLASEKEQAEKEAAKVIVPPFSSCLCSLFFVLFACLPWLGFGQNDNKLT